MFTHIDSNGNIKIVDIGHKDNTVRTAKAIGKVILSSKTIDYILNDSIQKGNVLTTAKIAGIMAAKKCSEIIPLCHNIQLNNIDINFKIKKEQSLIEIESTVSSFSNTGVEMEALTAVSTACLTVYDMCKSIDKNIVITNLCLLEKLGGKSGDYKRIKGEVLSVNVSKVKGQKKSALDKCKVTELGLEGDAHAGKWHKQVSLLDESYIAIIKERGIDIKSGDFGENITTRGIAIEDVDIGTKILIGPSVILEVTQIGKECHTRCNIYEQVGDCIMPKYGIFTKVINTGIINIGDSIYIDKKVRLL